MKGMKLGAWSVKSHPSIPRSAASWAAVLRCISGMPASSCSSVRCRVKAFVSFSKWLEKRRVAAESSRDISRNRFFPSSSSVAPERSKPSYVFSSNIRSSEVRSVGGLSKTALTRANSFSFIMMLLPCSESSGAISSASWSRSSFVSASSKLYITVVARASSPPARSSATMVFSKVGGSLLSAKCFTSSISFSIPSLMSSRRRSCGFWGQAGR